MAFLEGNSAGNSLTGGSGSDEILGLGGNDALSGGAGNDLIYGGTGSDVLFGGDDRDILFGDAGADSIDGGSSNDILQGGDGNDTLTGGFGDDIVFGGDGDDLLYGSADRDTLFGGGGDDTFLGVGYSARINGGAGRDTLDGSVNGDLISLLLNDDGTGEIDFGDSIGGYASMSFSSIEVFRVGGIYFFGSFSNRNDRVFSTDDGGEFNLRGGRDTFIGGTGSDALVMRPSDDVAGEVLNGGGGIFDTIRISSSLEAQRVDFTDDTLRNFEYLRLQSQGNGYDLTVELTSAQLEQFVESGRIYASNNTSSSIVTLKVVLGNQSDVSFRDLAITNSAGDNFKLIFAGDRDAERIGGTEYDDIIKGVAGNDILRGEGGEDLLLGGAGSDRLFGDDSDDILKGGGGNDRLFGGALADLLQGGGGNDLLKGGTEADILRGDNGNDRLFGGAGDDELIGGRGADVLEGGGGGDTFVFTRTADSPSRTGSRDTIRDLGAADRIDLSDIDANIRVAGDQSFNFVNRAAFSGLGGELRWKKSGTDVIVQIDTDGSRAGAEMEILLKGVANVDVFDFLL